MSYQLSLSCCKAFFFVTGLCASMFTLGHSASMPDGFVFDNSNEGEKITSAMLSKGSAGLLAECSSGSASGFPCKNIDLLAMLTPAEMGSGTALLNDIWGWTDPVTGREIAIVGRTNGTSFVDVSDGSNPVFLGFLPTHGGQTGAWRDIKVYQDHAFIVADSTSSSSHGLQVFDLSELFNVTPGSNLSETAHLGGFGRAHNIAINEDTGFAYVVGSNSCSGGLYMVDISQPASPSFAGCFSADGYTHDAECVVYQGSDTRYSGSEICMAYNEDTLTIVDVSNKSNPQQISRTPYAGARYTHQGWFFSDEHQYLILNDEQDEQSSGTRTTSYVFDLSLLDAPQLAGTYVGETGAVDHNLYAKGGLIYEANYRAGLRVLGAVDISQGCLKEVAYFDTIPNSNSAQFSGAWSSYIYFASGIIVVSDIESGLFVLSPDQTAIDNEVATLANDVSSCADNSADIPDNEDSLFNTGNGGGGAVFYLLLVAVGANLLARRRKL